MNKRQVRTMLRMMEGGGPVTVTIARASAKSAAQFAFLAQQFGYEYADARVGGGRNNALKMVIVPDPSPQAMSRAAQNRAQYPQARDGVELPPLVPDAVELLITRIRFDLSRMTRQRIGGVIIGATVVCASIAMRGDADRTRFVVAGCVWAALMVLLAFSVPMNRRRNAKYAALLQAAGFHPVTEKDGRVRYLPPGAAFPGQQVQTGPYGPYTAPPAGRPYAPPQPPQPPAPYGAQPPYDPRQNPYGQPPQG